MCITSSQAKPIEEGASNNQKIHLLDGEEAPPPLIAALLSEKRKSTTPKGHVTECILPHPTGFVKMWGEIFHRTQKNTAKGVDKLTLLRYNKSTKGPPMAVASFEDKK